MSSISFFNTRIQVAECKPGSDPRRGDSYESISSCANTLRETGDKALWAFRYLFNGTTVRLERQTEGDGKFTWAAGHVASFHVKKNTSESEGLKGTLESGQKTWLRTALAIICLVPGILIALVTKSLAYLSAETKKHDDLARLHFTPLTILLGEDKPFEDVFTMRSALTNAKDKSFDRPVDALVIHANIAPFKEGSITKDEIEALLQSIPYAIARLHPNKVIFTGIKRSTCNLIFQGQSAHQKALNEKGQWRLCFSARTVGEALSDPTERVYHVLEAQAVPTPNSDASIHHQNKTRSTT